MDLHCFTCCSDIWRQSRSAMKNMKMDIHAKLMSKYKQVPEWWFLGLLVGSIVLSLLMSFIWKTDVQLPWWGMIFAFGLAWIVTLPIGVIQATTNQVILQILLFPWTFCYVVLCMANRKYIYGVPKFFLECCSNLGMTL